MDLQFMSQIFGNVDRIFKVISSGICDSKFWAIIHRQLLPHQEWIQPLIYNFSVESSKWETITSYVENGCNSSECFKGRHADIFHLLQNELNFTYTIVSRDDAVGRKQSDGSYSGILGLSI